MQILSTYPLDSILAKVLQLLPEDALYAFQNVSRDGIRSEAFFDFESRETIMAVTNEATGKIWLAEEEPKHSEGLLELADILLFNLENVRKRRTIKPIDC